MGRPGVTYQEVVKAATAIQAKGENPTVDRVRAWLGTGSKATITPLLKQWKHEQAPFLKEQPNALPPDLLTMTHAFWSGMKAKADEIVADEKKRFKEQAERFEKNRRALTERLQACESELTTTQQTVQTLQDTNASLDARCQEQQRRLEYLTAQTTEQQQRIEAQQATVEKLNEQAKRAYDNLEHFRQATQEQREQEQLALDRQRTEWHQQDQAMRAQLDAQTRQIDEVTQQAQEAMIARDALTKENAQRAREIARLTADNQDAVKRLARAEERCQDTQARALTAEQKAEQAQAEQRSLREQLAQAHAQLAQTRTLTEKMDAIQLQLETQGILLATDPEKKHKSKAAKKKTTEKSAE